MPSKHEAGDILDINGISKTIKDNHGTVTAVAIRERYNMYNPYNDREITDIQSKINEAANKAIENDLVNEGDVVDFSYANSRLNEIDNGKLKKQAKGENGIYPTLKTNSYNYGVVVKSKKQELCDYIIDNNMVKPYDVINHSYSESRKKQIDNNKNIVISNNESPTLTTRPDTLGVAIPNEINNLKIRKLTPKECWRLMGFDDSDFNKAKNSGVSNSQLYKQAGNSIVVKVLEKIFANLFLK